MVTPLLSVVAAFAVGAVIIAWAGENPLEIYRTVFNEALFERTGLARHADPGDAAGADRRRLGLGFQANVWNIGAEGQMIVGGLCSIAVIGYVNDLPGAVLIPLGLLLGAVGGGLWGAARRLGPRRATASTSSSPRCCSCSSPSRWLTWAVRDPLKDPETLPARRAVSSATPPCPSSGGSTSTSASCSCSSSCRWPPG